MDDHFIARRKAHTKGGLDYYVGRFVWKVRGSVFVEVNNEEEVHLIEIF